MKNYKTLAASGLVYVLLALALTGCEQVTSGNFKGPITGWRTSKYHEQQAWEPSIKVEGKAVVLTWDEDDMGAGDFLEVFRFIEDNPDEPKRIARIVADGADDKLEGQIEFFDYFTDSAKSYVYYVVEYRQTGAGRWNPTPSGNSQAVKGLASDPAPINGSSNCSYDPLTGRLSFDPPIPAFANFVDAGIATILLELKNVLTDELYYISYDGKAELLAIDLVARLDDDLAGHDLSITFNPVYKKLIDGIMKYTYINHNYTLKGNTEVTIPQPEAGLEKPVTPVGFRAEAQSDGSIKLTWNAAPSVVTGYEIHYSDKEDGDYDYWNYTVVPGTATDYTDYDVDFGQTWHYKIRAFKYTDNGTAYSDLSAAVHATSAAPGGGATALQNNQWAVGTIGNNPQYYTFNALSGTSYYIQWNDSYEGTDAYTGDIKVSASSTANPEIFPVTDSGYDSPRFFTASSAGAVTIKVEGYFADSTGSYAIRYYTAPDTLAAPTGVVATAQSNGSIRIAWNPVNGATGYNIYYAETSYGFYYSDFWTTEELFFVDWYVYPGETWYYKVLAYNDDTESPLSNYAYATGLNASGASRSDAIMLPGGNGVHYLSSGDFWFKFYAPVRGYYILSGYDRYYNDDYESDIVIDVYDSSMNLIASNVDIGDDYATTVSRIWDAAQYYIRVRPYNGFNSNRGTFAIFIE